MNPTPNYKKISRLEEFVAELEGQHLEFKGKAAIDDRRILPRAVCALLNSEGGTVVVGVAEEQGIPRLDPILTGTFSEAQAKIRDRLIDMIDPRPPPETLNLRELSCARGFGLAIDVPPSPELHAVRDKGALSFYRRLGDRVVQLTMEEIRGRLAEKPIREQGICPDLKEWKERALKEGDRRHPYSGGLFLYLHGAFERVVWKEALNDLMPSVLDPSRLSIRREGWHYGSGLQPRRSTKEHDWLCGGDASSMYRRIEWSNDGRLRFATGLVPDILRPSPTSGDPLPGPFDTEGGHPDWEPHPSGLSFRPIWPKPLIETISSCCRLHAELLNGRNGLRQEVSGALLLTDVGSSRLGKEWIGHEDRDPSRSAHEHTYEYDETPCFEDQAGIEEYLSSPDCLAYKLVRRLYAEFGLSKEDVPYFSEPLARFQFSPALS